MLLADFVKVKICHQSIGLTVGTVWGVQIFLVDYSWTLTVNPFSSPLIKSRVMVSLSHVFIRQEAGYTLVRSPVHHKANRQKQTPIHFQIYTFSQLRITSWLSMHVFGHAIRSWSIQRTPSGQTPHRKPPPPQKKRTTKRKRAQLLLSAELFMANGSPEQELGKSCLHSYYNLCTAEWPPTTAASHLHESTSALLFNIW